MTQGPEGAQPAGEGLVEVKVLLTEDAWFALNYIAKAYKTNTTQALHQAITTELAVARSRSKMK